MKTFFRQVGSALREAIGVEEALFLIGLTLLYCGVAAQFGHAIAQIVSGSVLLLISVLILIKGSS